MQSVSQEAGAAGEDRGVVPRWHGSTRGPGRGRHSVRQRVEVRQEGRQPADRQEAEAVGAGARRQPGLGEGEHREDGEGEHRPHRQHSGPRAEAPVLDVGRHDRQEVGHQGDDPRPGRPGGGGGRQARLGAGEAAGARPAAGPGPGQGPESGQTQAQQREQGLRDRPPLRPGAGGTRARSPRQPAVEGRVGGSNRGPAQVGEG